jgi:hypothetical protein
VSYAAIATLTNDQTFSGRSQSAATEQSETFKDDGRADIAATARDVLRGNGTTLLTFTRMAAAGPGIGAKVDTGNGTIDQSLVTDEDLLSLTQANFPTVASLFYSTEGEPI